MSPEEEEAVGLRQGGLTAVAAQAGCSDRAASGARTGRSACTSRRAARDVDRDGGQRPVPQHRVGVGERVPADAAVGEVVGHRVAHVLRRSAASSRRAPRRGGRGAARCSTPMVLARQPSRPAVGDEVVGAHQHAVGRLEHARPAGEQLDGDGAAPVVDDGQRRGRRGPRRGGDRDGLVGRRRRRRGSPGRAGAPGGRSRRSPRRPASLRWCSMLSITPTPRSLTPILASMPNSVTVCTTRPSGCGIVQVNQPSDIASYQSQVCTATGGRPGGSETTVEHSVCPVGLAATRSSVRALTEATCCDRQPGALGDARRSRRRAAARPAGSSARPGSDQRSTSKGPLGAGLEQRAVRARRCRRSRAAKRRPSSTPRSCGGRTEDVKVGRAHARPRVTRRVSGGRGPAACRARTRRAARGRRRSSRRRAGAGCRCWPGR